MKKLCGILLALVLAMMLAVPAAAQAGEYVMDLAGLLDADERRELEEMASQAAQESGCGVYCVTVPDFREYDPESVYEAAKAVYRSWGLGLGEGRDGVMLLLSMNDRDYSLIAYGYGNTVFTDYNKDYLAEEFLPCFGENDWYRGFENYIVNSQSLLHIDQLNQMDPRDTASYWWAYWIVNLLLAAGGGAIACAILKRQMRSVAQGAEARDYVQMDTLKFTRREDRFLHRTVTRQKIEKPKPSGTTVDSSGFSGKSGKF